MQESDEPPAPLLLFLKLEILDVHRRDTCSSSDAAVSDVAGEFWQQSDGSPGGILRSVRGQIAEPYASGTCCVVERTAILGGRYVRARPGCQQAQNIVEPLSASSDCNRRGFVVVSFLGMSP
jgi:hypothetical protein